MADYNVNMKQWNGSSFDNVLPLAFNSKALEGKSLDDIIQYAQSYSTVDRLMEFQDLGRAKTINVSWDMTQYVSIEVIVGFNLKISGGDTMTYNVSVNNTGIDGISSYSNTSFSHMLLVRMSDGVIGYTTGYIGGAITRTNIPFDSLATITLTATKTPLNSFVEIIGTKK